MSTPIFDTIESAAIQPAAMALPAADAIKKIQEHLDAGVDINAVDKWGGTALILACMKDVEEVAVYLLEKGADGSIVDTSDTRSALHYASENAMSPVVERLLAAKVDTNGADFKGLTPLNMLCIGARDKFNIRNPKVTDSDGNVIEDHPSVVAINTKNQYVLDVARNLIAAGADVSLGPNQQNPLFLAAQTGNRALQQILLDAGLDPNSRDKFTLGPLHYAARAGMPETIEGLVDAGAEVDYQDECGFTALHEAILANSEDGVTYLLGKGASPTLKLGKGYKPYTNQENAIDMAKDKNLGSIVKLLEGAAG